MPSAPSWSTKPAPPGLNTILPGGQTVSVSLPIWPLSVGVIGQAMLAEAAGSSANATGLSASNASNGSDERIQPPLSWGALKAQVLRHCNSALRVRTPRLQPAIGRAANARF